MLSHFMRPVWAVLLALVVGAGLIVATEHNPLAGYGALFHGAFIDYYGIGGTLVKTGPILLAGLAVVIPLRAGLLNVGAEGQIYIGALCSSAVALSAPDLPTWPLFFLCVTAGSIAGGVWGVIPGYLKAVHGLNEVIVTILLNFIAINLVSYVAGGPMMAEGAPYPYSDEIRDDLWLTLIMPGTDAHSGVIIAFVLAIVGFLVLRFTTVGFALDAVGKSARAATYAGIDVRRYLILSMVVGGAIGGLAGTFEVMGLKYRLYHLFSPGYGYDGIVVAFLAGLNPIAVPFAAFFVAGLKAGALAMQRATGLEGTVVEVIQGLVIIFVAASFAMGGGRPLWQRMLRREAPATSSPEKLAAEP